MTVKQLGNCGRTKTQTQNAVREQPSLLTGSPPRCGVSNGACDEGGDKNISAWLHVHLDAAEGMVQCCWVDIRVSAELVPERSRNIYEGVQVKCNETNASPGSCDCELKRRWC